MLRISKTKKLGLLLAVALLASIIAALCYTNYSFADMQDNSIGDFQDQAYEEQTNITDKDVYESEFYNTETNENYKLLYKLNERKEATVNGYEGTLPSKLTIPDTLDEHKVITIGSCAFWNNEKLVSVHLPNFITSLGNQCFFSCRNLKQINFPESLNIIGNGAFCSCCLLSTIILPINLQNIETWAFNNCKNLKTLKVLSNKINCVGSGAFDYCNQLKWELNQNNVDNIDNLQSLVQQIENFVLPNGITSIPEKAFTKYGEFIKSITLPDSVTTIENHAFSCCEKLESITLQNSVTTIGDYAFYTCKKLKSITLPDSVTTIGNYAFSYCEKLEYIKLPKSLKTIKESSFKSCMSLKSIKLPDTVEIIEKEAFSGSRLASINLPPCLITIKESAFSNCTSLSSVTFPESLIKIEKDAFLNCSVMKDMYFNGGQPLIEPCAFFNLKFNLHYNGMFIWGTYDTNLGWARHINFILWEK